MKVIDTFQRPKVTTTCSFTLLPSFSAVDGWQARAALGTTCQPLSFSLFFRTELYPDLPTAPAQVVGSSTKR